MYVTKIEQIQNVDILQKQQNVEKIRCD